MICSFIQQLLSTYYGPSIIFRTLRDVSLNNIDEVCDVKELKLSWRQTDPSQAAEFLTGQVVIRAMKINKTLREVETWRYFAWGGDEKWSDSGYILKEVWEGLLMG